MTQLLLPHVNRKYIQIVFALFSVVVLTGQSAVPVLAVTTNPAGATGKVGVGISASISAEINRRSIAVQANLTLARSFSVVSGSVVSQLTSSLNTAKRNLTNLQSSLGSAGTNATKIKAVATRVDNIFAQYKSTNQATKLLADTQSQNNLISNLTDTANTIQRTIDAAKSNGATHVNGGVGGFISLQSVQTDLNQLKQNLNTDSAVTGSVSTMLALPIRSGLADQGDSASSIFSASYGQLSVSQNSLQNTGAGLSQLSNVVTGNQYGVSYCGLASNCNGNENKGLITVCGVGSNCIDNTNNGVSQKCGVGSNCTNNTNNGFSQNCGIGSNCTNSTNNGLFANCGVASNCSGSTNNGVVASCGVASNCSNSTNNGIAAVCGLASNCSNSTNNGGVAICGVGSNCIGSTNNGVLAVCGVVSNCAGSTNNGLVAVCGLASNCAGSTNNGAIASCGVLSNCAGSTNNGFLSICGLASDCSNSTTNNPINVCGILSNCSTTTKNVTVEVCKVPAPPVYVPVNSDNIPTYINTTPPTKTIQYNSDGVAIN